MDTADINTATQITIGNLISTGSQSDYFAGLSTQIFGPVAFTVSTPGSFSFGNATFGSFAATSIIETQNTAGARSFYVRGTFTAGTFNPTLAPTPAPASLLISFTQSPAGSGAVSDSATLSIPPTPPPPTVTAITPTSGSTAGGTSVTITGTGFVAGATVSIGGSAATNVNVTNDTTITCTTPSGTAGATGVLVTTTGGTNAVNSLYTYYVPERTILTTGATGTSGVSGIMGTRALPGGAGGNGGDALIAAVDSAYQILSGNFVGGAGGIGGTGGTGSPGVPASSDALNPPGPGGMGGMGGIGGSGGNAIVAASGSSIVVDGGTFTGGIAGLGGQGGQAGPGGLPSPPLFPDPGPIGHLGFPGKAGQAGFSFVTNGGTITLNGTFTGGGQTLTSGAGSFTGTLKGNSEPQTFTYKINSGSIILNSGPVPTVTAISPNSGSTAGGTNVTITGTNFAESATVTIGGAAAANVTVTSATTITCTTPPGKEGRASVEVTTSDGKNAANSLYTYTILNTAPTIGTISAQATLEDTASAAGNFTVGDAQTAAADLQLTAASSNPTLVPVANVNFGGSGGTRTVSVTPAKDQNGTAEITVTVSDGSLTAQSKFTVTVTAVNDAPSFVKGVDVDVKEDSGATTLSAWATNLSSGPSDESEQTLSFEITSNSNPKLFRVAPAVNSSGDLSFTLQRLTHGSAQVKLKIEDNGGTDNGGVAESTEQTFNIVVGHVNHPPTTVGAGIPNQTVPLNLVGINLSLLSYFTDLDVQDTLSFSVQGSTHTSTVTASMLGSSLKLVGVALGTTKVTIRCTDNAEPPEYVEHTFNVTVGTFNPTLTVVGGTKLNRSTGLLEHTVRVTNSLGRDIEGVRITVTNQTSVIKLWNKTHPTLPIMEHRVSMAKDAVKEFILEFYSTKRAFGSFRPQYLVEEFSPKEDPFITATGANPLSVKAQKDGGVLVVFASKVGQSYLIEYSDTGGATWRLSPVAIKAGATRVQWVDRGPPFTMTAPAIPVTRQYRVRLQTPVR